MPPLVLELVASASELKEVTGGAFFEPEHAFHAEEFSGSVQVEELLNFLERKGLLRAKGHRHKAVCAQRPIGLATVYRSLDALQLLGLVQHRVTLTGETLYSAVDHDHPYLTCLHSGTGARLL